MIDDDNPEWTEEDFARARPFKELHPEWFAAWERRRLGRPPKAEPKRAVSLRLDARTVERLRASGPGWQTRVNEALGELLDSGRL